MSGLEPRQLARHGLSTECHFHRRDVVLDPTLVFLALPFHPALPAKRITQLVKDTVGALYCDAGRLKCVRADDLCGHDVMQDVYESMAAAACVIVETTKFNPNVFLELGMAITLGKPLILITRDPLDTIPFDLRRFRHFEFSFSDEGRKKLVSSVANALEQMLGAKPTSLSIRISNSVEMKLVSKTTGVGLR